MLFNSVEFAIFLVVVFILYWYVFNKNLRTQNLLLLAVSYFFYGWWDWRFLSLIIFSSFVDFIIGLQLGKETEDSKRKRLLAISIFVNLGFLGFFKYFNFFAESFVEAFTLLGSSFSIDRLSIILPVGISFYTFQTLSYSIDVYRKKLEPSKDIIAFFAFVSFFPQLVAGPIERATNLLPQFFAKRKFEYSKAIDGMYQILWGLFKKVVVADNCAVQVDAIFGNYEAYSGPTLLLGGIYFAFQIYCDFSGYSDIAIGTARLFGFNLMQNFAFPYFSRDIAEFWRRWHISLSTWFRDYLYIPLGGSRGGKWMRIRNTFAIFLVSGFWHGANWTFIVWGFINACYFLPLLLTNQNRRHLDVVAQNSLFPSIKELIKIGYTFLITVLAWIFFRAESLSHAWNYLERLIWTFDFSIPLFLVRNVYLSIILLLAVEWTQREKQHGLAFSAIKLPKVYRWSFCYLLIYLIITNSVSRQEFIYFQF